MVLFIASALATPVHQSILTLPNGVAHIQRTSTTPNHTVYGYLPYWSSDPSTVDLSGLTHIAYFDATITEDGSLTNTNRWEEAAPVLVPKAHAEGIQVHLCVSAFSDSIINSVLSNQIHRNTLISDIQSLVTHHQADGVNIDIEGMDTEQRDNFTVFIAELSLVIPEIVIATPAVDWSDAYDYTALSAYATLFIMAYDYHWSGSDPGPVDPLFGGGQWGQYSIEWTVNNYLDHNVDPNRIIVGLPLYGRVWDTVDNSVPGSSTGTSSSIFMFEAVMEAQQNGGLYDVITESPYILYSNEQVWYPDVNSVETRILWAMDQNVQGIGFWALGYENGLEEFWPMVADSVGTSPDTVDDNQAPIANAGEDQTVSLGSTVLLDGQLSMDPNGDALTYSWSFIAETAHMLTQTETSTTAFSASESGSWTIQLIVSDGELSDSDTTTIVVNPEIHNDDTSENADGDELTVESRKSGCDSGAISMTWWMFFTVGTIPFRRRIR